MAPGLTTIFMGTPALACPALEAMIRAGYAPVLVVTQPDRPAGRGRKPRASAIAQLAQQLKLPTAKPRKIAELAPQIRELAPDVIVVVAYGQLLPPEILDIPAHGCVNLHFSLLPQLRGAAPVHHAILQGLSTTGVSTMFMAPSLDTGDIILQRSSPVDERDTTGSLSERLANMGAQVLVETLGLIEQGSAPRTPQDHSRASYAPALTKAHARVEWSRPAREVDRLIRAMDPVPGAWSTWRGKNLRLFAPTIVLPYSHGQSPGTVLSPRAESGGYLLVACGEGMVGIGRLQAPGKRVLGADEFLRGARLTPGEVLGR